MTLLDPQLLQAYQDTDYLTESTPVGLVALRPGQMSTSLEHLFSQISTATDLQAAAFITAFNPFGLRLPGQMNEARHADLRTLLDAGVWTYFEGAGVGLDHAGWEPEKSFLVFGLPKRTAMDIGLLFQQNAVVFINRGHSPEIVTLSSVLKKPE